MRNGYEETGRRMDTLLYTMPAAGSSASKAEPPRGPGGLFAVRRLDHRGNGWLDGMPVEKELLRRQYCSSIPFGNTSTTNDTINKQSYSQYQSQRMQLVLDY